MFNSIFKDYKLVGGIYFALLMDFRKKYTDGKKYQEKQDDIFRKLVKLLGFKDLSNLDTLSDRISRYKRCTDENLTNNFTKDVIDKISDYKTFSSICEDLKKFFDEKYESEDDKKNLLVAIRNLLLEDSEIKRKNEEFRVTNSGDFLTRNEIESNKEFSFEPFILGTLFYAITIPNRQGADTFDYLFSKQGRDYKYNGKLYNSSDSEIKITHFKKQDSFIPVKEEQTRFQEKKLDYSLNDDDFDYFYESCCGDFENYSLIDKIQKKQKLYVTTESYKEGLKKLERNGVLVITGNPGDGKSTTAEMITVKYTSLHKCIAHYRYGHSEIDDLLQEIKTNPNKDTEELYYIDDFMGQAVYELTSNEESNFEKLCSYIKRYKTNKKLILCSRIKIIEEQKAVSFRNRLLEAYLEKDYHLSIKHNLFEKGQILLHHLIEKTDEKHYADIQKNRRYLQIINNKSFIPRSIEHVCKSYNKVPIFNDGDFFNYFNSVLSNPECIWENVYNNDLEEDGRLLLAALYSLTNNRVEISKCKKVFNALINSSNLSSSMNQFNHALSEVNNSMVSIQHEIRPHIFKNPWIKKELRPFNSNNNEEIGPFIAFADPSVHDYLMNSVFTNDSSANNLLEKGIIYSEQVDKLKGKNSSLYYKELAISDRLLDLSFSDGLYQFNTILNCIHSYGIMNIRLKKYLNENISYISDFLKKGTFRFSNHINLLLLSFIKNPVLLQFYLDGPIEYELFNCLLRYCPTHIFQEIIEAVINNPESISFILDSDTKKELVLLYLNDYASDFEPSFGNFETYISYEDMERDKNIINNDCMEQLFHSTYANLLEMDFFLTEEEIENIHSDFFKNVEEIDFANNYSDYLINYEEDNDEEHETQKNIPNNSLNKIDELFSHSYTELKSASLL